MTTISTNPFEVVTLDGEIFIKSKLSGELFDRAFRTEQQAQNEIENIVNNRLHEIFKTKVDHRLLFSLSDNAVKELSSILKGELTVNEIEEITPTFLLYYIVSGSIIDAFDIANDKLKDDKIIKKLFGIEEIDMSYTYENFDMEIKEDNTGGIFSEGVRFIVNILIDREPLIILNHYNLLHCLYSWINEENIFCAEVYVNGVNVTELPYD